jgi:hypothetical protein
LSGPGYIYKRRHVVVCSLSGSAEHEGIEVWVLTCSLHPEAYVSEANLCDQCWEEGRYQFVRFSPFKAQAAAAR